MTEVSGASPDGDRAVMPSASSPQAVSPVPASIPSAEAFYKVRQGIRHHLMTGLIFRSTGRDPNNTGYAFAEVPDWQLRQWLEIVDDAAQAMSARSAETEGLSPKDASAVGNADAPISKEDPPHA